MKRLLILVVVLFPLLGLAALLHTASLQASPPAPNQGGVTFTVNSTIDATDANPGDGVCETAVGNGECTLRAAVQETNALPGMDIIQLPSGIYILSISGVGENSAETGDLDITGSLTIFGAGTSNTVIDAGNQDRVLHIVYYEEPNSVFISDLTIRGGLLDSELLAGSGLHNESGFVTLTNVSVRGNQTVNYGQGAGIYNSGTLTLTSSAVLSNATSSNSGAGYGGGIYNNHSLTLKNSLVAYNTNGGGIHNHAGTVEISDSIISWNQRASPADGGGVANSFGAVMTLTNSIISHNTACNGAGMLNGVATPGGEAFLHVFQTVIENNIIPCGGGSGGGINNQRGNVTVISSTIQNNGLNFPVAWGGGVFNYSGLFTARNSTITGNRASAGGGIFLHNGVGELTNVTIAHNEGDFNGAGGIAIGIFTTAQVLITSSTIFSNANGGISLEAGVITITHSIIAANTGQNCDDPIISVGYNIDSGNSCGFSNTGDMVNTDPLLGPLQDNGGPTLTHALLTASPAIDAGDNVNCPATDQRGGARPVDGDGDNDPVCDIGAYEYGALQLTAVPDTITTTQNIPVLIDVLANDIPGDNGEPTLASVGEPGNGTAVITNNLVLYAPDLDFTGVDNFTYTITDGVVTDTAVVTVTVQPPIAPTAVDDTAETLVGEPVLIDVLANDLPGSSGDPVLESVGTPGNGTAVITNTFILYTPAPDFFGTDTFTYTIADGVLTDTAVVTVTVLPVDDQTYIYLPVVLKPDE